MRFHCPSCSQVMECPDGSHGKTAICPKCGNRSVIPAPQAPASQEPTVESTDKPASGAPSVSTVAMMSGDTAAKTKPKSKLVLWLIAGAVLAGTTIPLVCCGLCVFTSFLGTANQPGKPAKAPLGPSEGASTVNFNGGEGPN